MGYNGGKFLGSIAIIPARGGSQRIPRKNIKEFCGQPIIKYAIDAALISGIFDEVIVSTDDEEIAGIAKQCGAQVPFMRSSENAGNFATTEDVITEVLHQYKNKGRNFDLYCCLYATAPFVTAKRLKEALQLLISSKASFLTPVIKYSHPPQRCRVIRDGKLEMKWPEYKEVRSQDLEPWYHDCGQFYFGRTDDFFKSGMAGANVVPMILPEAEVQDIDTEDDWFMAEMKYRLLNRYQK